MAATSPAVASCFAASVVFLGVVGGNVMGRSVMSGSGGDVDGGGGSFFLFFEEEDANFSAAGHFEIALFLASVPVRLPAAI